MGQKWAIVVDSLGLA